MHSNMYAQRRRSDSYCAMYREVCCIVAHARFKQWTSVALLPHNNMYTHRRSTGFNQGMHYHYGLLSLHAYSTECTTADIFVECTMHAHGGGEIGRNTPRSSNSLNPCTRLGNAACMFAHSFQSFPWTIQHFQIYKSNSVIYLTIVVIRVARYLNCIGILWRSIWIWLKTETGTETTKLYPHIEIFLQYWKFWNLMNRLRWCCCFLRLLGIRKECAENG